MLDKKIVFIGGGNMAEGIIRGLINTETLSPKNIYVSEIIKKRQEYLEDTFSYYSRCLQRCTRCRYCITCG